jgi:hypothetical protein
LLTAVRSNDSLAIAAALHQLEPTPLRLMPLKLPLKPARKSLVKALQSAFDRMVSE